MEQLTFFFFSHLAGNDKMTQWKQYATPTMFEYNQCSTETYRLVSGTG